MCRLMLRRVVIRYVSEVIGYTHGQEPRLEGSLAQRGQERSRMMAKEQMWGSSRRVAVMSMAAIAVIAASVGVTIWRYQTALSRSAVAISAHADQVLTNALVGEFWHERESIREYLLIPKPAFLAETRLLRAQFAATAATLARAEPPADAILRAQAEAGNAQVYAVFAAQQAAAGTTAVREEAANGLISAAEPRVLEPIGQLAARLTQRSNSARADARSAA